MFKICINAYFFICYLLNNKYKFGIMKGIVDEYDLEDSYMNKILVIVYVPIIDEKYNIFIPINKKIGTVKNVIINTISELSETNIALLQNMKLYDKESGNILNNNIYVKASEIENGSELILL